jgi:ATP-dependent exoDNAse (exonuclease V) alpha subunit
MRVYTGITGGKKSVVVVGQRKALAIGVRNNKMEQRFSGLPARLSV